MEQSIQQKISAGYRADLVECIEKALIGQLSPSDQEYCFEEIKSLKGTDEYPPDGDHLLCQLRDILSITPQISEHDHETSAVESFGGRLLLFDYYDRYTLLELVEQPNGAGYDSFVFISNAKHGAALEQITSTMKSRLDAWLMCCDLPHGHIFPENKPDPSVICRYATLDEALTYLYTALVFPGSILT